MHINLVDLWFLGLAGGFRGKCDCGGEGTCVEVGGGGRRCGLKGRLDFPEREVELGECGSRDGQPQGQLAGAMVGKLQREGEGGARHQHSIVQDGRATDERRGRRSNFEFRVNC